jgi:hypothetical protein
MTASEENPFYRPQATLAKIGKRYYWAMYRYCRPDEARDDEGLNVVRLADGFTNTREAAAEQIAAIFDETDPGSEQLLKQRLEGVSVYSGQDKTRAKWNRDCLAGRSFYGADHDVRALARNPGKSFSWARGFSASGGAAEVLYKLHHGKKRQAKHSHAQADLGFIYTWNSPIGDSEWEPYWEEHRITKITRKRVFIVERRGDRQTSLPRQDLERDGEYRPRDHGWWQSSYYTEAGKRREDEARARSATSGVPSEHADALGLGANFNRDDVMRAFRQRALEHHPDKGGDPAVFRDLVKAKDRALAALSYAKAA